MPCGFRWIALLAAFVSSDSVAGPPLFSDDPYTIGAGNVEAIVSLSAYGISSRTDLLAPIADVTLGLLTGLDATLWAAPSFELSPGAATSTAGSVVLGVKWQPVRGDHWNAAFTPSVSINLPEQGETAIYLPVQVEYARGRFAVGADGSWAVVVDAPDLWHASLYGTYQPSPDWSLLSEIVAFRSPADQSTQVLLDLGVDWTTPLGLHLLAAAGPGLGDWGGDRTEWHAYLGLQWNFTLWSRH